MVLFKYSNISIFQYSNIRPFLFVIWNPPIDNWPQPKQRVVILNPAFFLRGEESLATDQMGARFFVASLFRMTKSCFLFLRLTSMSDRRTACWRFIYHLLFVISNFQDRGTQLNDGETCKN